MTLLTDVLDPVELTTAVENGHVTDKADGSLGIVYHDGAGVGWGRKGFAAAAVRSEHRGLLFLRLDGEDYRPALWQQARPAGDLTATKVTEG